MEKNTERFLHLLRCGLWEEDVCLPLFVGKDTDWELVLHHAQKQTVTGLLWEGMSRLPSECLPSKKLYLELCARVAQIEMGNEWLNVRLSELWDQFSENGIAAVLLKGQGAASRYPKPLRRVCGDIDVYVGHDITEQVEKVLLVPRIVHFEDAYEKHCEYHWKGIVVEVHYRMTRFYNPWKDTRFDREIRKWFPNGAGNVQIEERTYAVPPPTFDAVYMLKHIYGHILEGGIALRQVCDWVLLLHKEKEKIDVALFESYLRHFGMKKVYGAMAHLSVTYLGLKAENLPLPVSRKDRIRGELIMQDILAGGNFGKYKKKGALVASSRLRWHISNFQKVCVICYRFFSFAPGESIWYPMQKIRFFLKKI